MVRRDFLIHHQQTLLGPAWVLLQPLIVLAIYLLIFEKAVGLSTDGVHPTLFYLSGIILWSLFAETFAGTSQTFVQNAQLFSKVYFPRLLVPLSNLVLNYFRFGIHLVLFLAAMLWLHPGAFIDRPFWILGGLLFTTLFVGVLGLGVGMIFSVLTAKYRDLVNVMHLFIRLLLFATPVIYPLSMVDPQMRWLLNVNPLTPLFEVFRYSFLNAGTFTPESIVYTVGMSVALVLFGSMLFNKFGNRLQDVL